jgi:hypothetical protein
MGAAAAAAAAGAEYPQLSRLDQLLMCKGCPAKLQHLLLALLLQVFAAAVGSGQCICCCS